MYEDVDLLVLTGLCPNNETTQEQADRYALNGILGGRARATNKLTVLLDERYEQLPTVSQSNNLRTFVKEMEADNGLP
jgi:hypothetical protein